MEQTTDMDKLSFSKLQMEQVNQKEEPLEGMELLIPPPTEAAEDMTKNTDRDMITEAERKL